MRAVYLVAVVLVIALIATVSANTVRQPAVAGQFYPADSTQLAEVVQSHLDSAICEDIDGDLIALIVPHAGLVYSGAIAAHSYRCLEGSGTEAVIMCGPSHRVRLDGASVYGPEVTWHTPLGDVPCDSRLCREFATSERIGTMAEAHAREHCLEVQLPYLQTVLDDFSIVPVVLGFPSDDNIAALTEQLVKHSAEKNTVMIASTDWQHYRPAEEGGRMDSLGIACLKDLDPNRLRTLLKDNKIEMCGGGATVAVLRAARKQGANRVKILRYGDSGDISGDKSSVVGYVAAAIYRANTDDQQAGSTDEPSHTKGNDMAEDDYLADDDKQELLKLARTILEAYFGRCDPPDLSKYKGVLGDPGAAFVTLTKNGKLRGCIGYTVALVPLGRTVTECAISAATKDTRFPEVESSELDQLHIEISVLTPLQEVTSLDEIVVGRDGLMISQGNRRGLLLPQVATEYGWDREEFLRNTCRKAGLKLDAYLESDVTIERFQAIVFGEHE